MISSANALDTSARPVLSLLNGYMEVFHHLQIVSTTQGKDDWLERMSTEKFPLAISDLSLVDVEAITVIMCRPTGADPRYSSTRGIRSVLRKLSVKTSRDKRNSITNGIWNSVDEVDF